MNSLPGTHQRMRWLDKVCLIYALLYCILYLIAGEILYQSLSHILVGLILLSVLWPHGLPSRLAVESTIIFVVIPPYLYMASSGATQYGIIVAAGYIVVWLYLWAAQWLSQPLGVSYDLSNKYGTVAKVVWPALLLMSLLGGMVGSREDSDTVLFIVPFTCSLMFFELHCRRIQLLRRLLLYVALYILVVIIYVLFLWNGFGRLVVGVYFLLPILVAQSYRDIGLRSWQIAFFAPVLLVAAHLSRFETGGQLENDSGNGHYVITSQMIKTIDSRPARGWEAFFDQWQLLVLQWVPRSWWPSKPIGIGSSFVDDWMGRSGYAPGHSVALGFMGEQLWLVGYWFVFGVCVFIGTILVLRYITDRISFGFITPLIVLDLFLNTYIWGGAAAYSARAIVTLIPLLLLAVALGGAHAEHRQSVGSPRRK